MSEQREEQISPPTPPPAVEMTPWEAEGVDRATYELFYEEPEPRPSTPEEIAEALSLAGAWSDIDYDEMMDALYEIRHRNPPSPPVTDETLGI